MGVSKMKEYRYKGIKVSAKSKKEAIQKIIDVEVTGMATVIKTNSMSIGTSDDKHHKGEPYFKVWKGSSYESAEKMCRISFERAEYIKEHSNNNNAENWILNSKERKELVKLFKSKMNFAGDLQITRWQYAIIQFNSEKGIDPGDTMKIAIKNPKYIKSKDLLPFNLPMPYYTKLQ